MKIKKKVIGLFTCLLIIFLTTNDLIYALHQNVLSGYNQVTNIGGSNSKNTNNEQDGVTVSKTIEETNIENYFDITLTVNTTSKIEEITTQPDVAIVIVMDISNTMKTNKVSANSTQTRYQAAMAAGETFINKFAESSIDVNSKRQLGYVSFNTNVYKTFELQEVKSPATATNLISTMKTSTGNIINASGYGNSTEKYTNIEGGLKMAWDMLEETNVNHKYVILLSDGYPTTYLNNTTDEPYDGYSPYSYNVTESSEGVFANSNLNKPCSAGVDYSDRGAIKTREIATNIKNDGIEIMVVGTGISTVTTIEGYLERWKDEDFSTVDTNTTNYEIGVDTNPDDDENPFENWLRTSIGSNKYYNSDDSSLTEAYLEIFNEIQRELEVSTQATWVAEDPMGVDGTTPNIEFLGLYDDNNNLHDSIDNNNDNQSDTASYNNNKISWDLKVSDYDNTEVVNGVTHYIYKVKYRIRLENELENFNPEMIYQTNGRTTLSYVVSEDGILSPTKYIDFPIPAVVGYLGNFTFTKKSSFDNANLSGAKFKLEHNPDCVCHSERKYATIEDIYQISDINGTITFENIPSGHTYILTEIESPTDHELSTNVHNITVSYGTVTGSPEDNIFINEISKGNLEIQKLVSGNITNPGEFEFILEVYFKGNKISGTYDYKINDTEVGTIDLTNGIIKLKKDDKMVIYNLPVGATYNLKETTTNGFKVEYQVNSLNKQLGEIAICSENNYCRIEKGDTNKVVFTNSAGYILPATGSSSMLILIIIGILLLGTPVIYIGYSFYKHIRKIA